MSKKPNPHRGSSLDDLLAAESVLETFQAAAIKETIAFQITQAMEREGITKTEMAKRMNTTRAQLNRLLSPKHNNVTLETLCRAANVLGHEIKVELI